MKKITVFVFNGSLFIEQPYDDDSGDFELIRVDPDAIDDLVKAIQYGKAKLESE